MTTALWPLLDVPNTMTSVHGSCLLPLVKSRSEALTSLRGVSSKPPLTAFRSLLLYEMRQSRDLLTARWPGPGQGGAISLIAVHEGTVPATFVGLGERGKPSEAVADEAVDGLLAYEAVSGAAVDLHSADQIVLPLALASGRSEFTTTEATAHLRTNVETIRAFLDREITIEEASGEDEPAKVVIE